MDEEMNLEIGISGDGLNAEETANTLEQMQLAEEERNDARAELEAQKTEEAKVEANAPEGATIGDYAADTLIGLGAGARDIASNIITAPERVIDLFNGEMTRESQTEEGYQTEWDQFMYGDGNPIETKTWWGGLVRGSTNVLGTLALTGGTVKLVKGGTLAASLANGALTGAKFDLVAKTSQDDNLSGMLKERFTWLDTPLATKEHDHPAMKTLKNVVEGMGIGAVFDATIFKMMQGAQTPAAQALKEKGKGTINEVLDAGKRVYQERGALGDALKEDFEPLTQGIKNLSDEVAGAKPEELTGIGQKVQEFINSRKSSIELQKRAEVAEQIKEPGFRAPKNEDIADPWQGATTSTESVADVRKGIRDKKTKWGAEDGSTGSFLSNTEVDNIAKNSGQARNEIEKAIKKIYGEYKIRDLEETAKRQGKTVAELMSEDFDIYQKVYEGRNTSDLTPTQFWKSVNANKIKKTVDGKVVYSYVSPDQANAIDLINASLFSDIRDQGITARELANIADLKDIDGPAQQMVKKLIAGLRIRKIQKADISQQMRDLQTRKGVSAARKKLSQAELNEFVDKDVQKSIDAFRMALDMTDEQTSDEIFKTLFEGISMAKDVQTLDDLDNFMRVWMKGGEYGLRPKQTGALLREMGSMFTHSVLSGPKTAVRAVLGTSTATFTRPMAMALGGALRGDSATMRAGLASMNAMREAIPESFELFKRKLNSYWAGDISTMKTRFYDPTELDNQWTMHGQWAETRGNMVDKAIYRTANTIRTLNDSSLLTYSTKIMAATDDAFGLIIGRARAREKAFLKAAENLPDSNFANLDAKFFRDMEDNFNSQIFDKDGNLTSEMAKYAKKEATLTQDLTGFGAKMADAFNEAPWARPFFLFARTGINGLTLTAKHTPGFNFLVKEFNLIAKAKTPIPELQKYGIYTQRDLLNAKAVQNGRLAMGTAALSMASMAYLSGNLHGNGPTDRQQRQAWLDAGWKPRTIKIGDVWVNYDAFEPYNQILALVGDIGDHQQLMGEEWAEDRLSKLAMALASTATSKSYLAGLQSFVDLFSGAPGQQSRIVASLMNNTIPLSGLRNEIGKVLTPYTRELGSDIGSSIRNRNLITEGIAADPLPIKYDILTGRPIKDHDFITRMFNAVSPVNFNLDYSPGRELLFNSGYDMRTSTYSAPDGTDLSDSPKVRSMFQKAIGEQNLLAEFEEMAQDEAIQTSIAEMNWHRKNGMSDVEPRSFPHYKRIAKAFDRAKKRAWASIKDENDVQKLLVAERDQKLKNREANKGTIKKIIEMPK